MQFINFAVHFWDIKYILFTDSTKVEMQKISQRKYFFVAIYYAYCV